MTLVDASSWIEFLRGRDSLPGQRVKSLLAHGRATWCGMTWGQMEKSTLEELEGELPLCPVNEAVWSRARKLARSCREHGVNAPSADIVIAACAVEHKLNLEHNDSHFAQILPLAAKP
jgi:predicted nucleic acid-binding protein